MRRLNYSDIERIEEETTAYSSSLLRGVKEYYPKIIDVLLQLVYFTGKESGENNEANYHLFCCHQYYHSGYSLRAAFILYEKGYYLEANALLRRVLEILVKIRYLKKHKNLTMGVWANEKTLIEDGSKLPQIKEIFNEVSPTLYDNYYGLIFSGFVHGGLSSSLGRINYKGENKGLATLGPVWNEDSATFFVNFFNVVSLGYLVYFPIVFKKTFQDVPEELSLEYLKSTKWLSEAIATHRLKYPDSASWHEAIAPLID